MSLIRAKMLRAKAEGIISSILTIEQSERAVEAPSHVADDYNSVVRLLRQLLDSNSDLIPAEAEYFESSTGTRYSRMTLNGILVSTHQIVGLIDVLVSEGGAAPTKGD